MRARPEVAHHAEPHPAFSPATGRSLVSTLLLSGPMEPVILDPRDYRGTYKLVGGLPSLDLVNTISWPGRPREHDWFDPPENVATWAVAAGILDDSFAGRINRSIASVPTQAMRERARVRHIRSTVSAVLIPHAFGNAPPQDAVAALNKLLVRAAARRVLDVPFRAWTFEEPVSLEHVLAPAILNAADVIIKVDPARLGHCPSCDWLFLDTTRNGRRTWCDMADCGTRAKSRRYYHRQQE